MSGIKISALPAVGAALLTDIFPVVQGGVTSQEALSQVVTLFNTNIQLAAYTQVTGLGNAATRTASDVTKTNLASVSGSITAGHFAVFADSNGTILDGGAAPGGFLPLSGGTMTGSIVFSTTKGIQTNTSAGNTMLLQAYNTNTAAYVTFATLTANNPPTMDLSTSVTQGGAVIYRVGGSTVSLTDGGTNAALTASNGGIVWSNATQLQILAGTATSGLPLLSGSTATPSWGAFALSLGGALTTSGAVIFSGAFSTTFTITAGTSVTFPTSGTLATTSQIPSGAALTRTSDTNVTLTLGGTPATALLQATSITAGWSGQLALSRGGSNADLSGTVSNGGLVYSTATAMAILAAGSAGQIPRSGGAGAPTWSTATYPAAAGTANNVLSSDGTNVVSSTLTSVIDAALGSAQGDILYRNSSVWTVLAPGTSGFFLQTKGSAANPVWASAASGGAIVSVNEVVLTSTGTYTATAGTIYIWVRAIAGGGGGGGATSSIGGASVGGGGGAGAYGEYFGAYSVPIAYAVGAAGAAGSAGGTGGTGGATTFGTAGALLNLAAGAGGAGMTNQTTQGQLAAGGAGGAATTALFGISGGPGTIGYTIAPSTSGLNVSGGGAPSPFGAGAPILGVVNNAAGVAGTGFGSGGGGASANGSGGSQLGGAGGIGTIVITEYIA